MNRETIFYVLTPTASRDEKEPVFLRSIDGKTYGLTHHLHEALMVETDEEACMLLAIVYVRGLSAIITRIKVLIEEV